MTAPTPSGAAAEQRPGVALPWTRELGGGRGAWIKDAKGQYVALSCGDTDAAAEDHGHVIVRAVNSRDDLVSALKAMVAIYDGIDLDMLPEGERDVLAAARTALAVAAASDGGRDG